MCGIAGIYRKDSKVEELKVKTMTDSLSHRGPDGEGFWVENNIGLGHRRLAIVDLTEQGSQPMISSDKRFVITFNGEIYNYPELKAELENKGYVFKTHTDTEVLLCAYQEYGKSVLSRLDGMFAFAIWDIQQKELFCARDRFGEKPFYFYHDNKQFLFASEMKAFFSAGIEKIVNNKMIFLYLQFDLVENPNNKQETFYQNIKQLPASSYMIVDKRFNIEIEKYWYLNIQENKQISFIQAKEQFVALFDISLKRRFRADVNVGSSLSGGVDSSSIVCSAKTLFPEVQFNTFTARFNNPNFDEGSYIDKLQEEYEFNRFETYPSGDLLIDKLDKIFYHQEEPFGSTSIVAQWEVVKTARYNNTIVLLDGQGADETLAGYFKYFLPYLYEIRKNKNLFNAERDKIRQLLGNDILSNTDKYRLLSPKLYDFISSKTRQYRSFNKLSVSKELYNENKKDTVNLFHNNTELKPFLINDIFSYGLGKLLRFSDRNAMAHSVEVRLPYLYHELVEFVFSLPSNFFIKDGWTKYILRTSMEKRVPKEILYRKDKKGFQAPDTWLENKKVKNIINQSFDLIRQEKVVDKFELKNSWKYIMISKLYAR